jgi:hypothetical protein
MRSPHRRLALGATLLLLALLGSCAVAGRGYSPAVFPGATETASGTLVRYLPNLAVRSTGSYRTDARFTDVYNWYSQRFDLGPEAHAQGTCLLMARSFTSLWVISEQITVTVCGTPNGQMMFVTRSSVLRYSRLAP